MAYHELASAWPNHEWWLAVNPGLPIEGYLPPWFVSQLARGDVRMPGRTPSSRARVTRTYAPPDAPESAGVEPPAMPRYGTRARSFTRGTAAAAATGARREAARATATAARSVFTPTPPPPVDEPLEAEMVDAEAPYLRATGAHSAHRTVTNRPAAPVTRRPRRHDATIIDAEIIESTVLGAAALDAMVVNATVIDASKIDSDVIDATLVSIHDTTTRHVRPERASISGSAATPDADVDDSTTRRMATGGADDDNVTRRINVNRASTGAGASADSSVTQVIRPAAAAAGPDPSVTQRIDPREVRIPSPTRHVDMFGNVAAGSERPRHRQAPEDVDDSATRRIDLPTPEGDDSATRVIRRADRDADASATRRIRLPEDARADDSATRRIDMFGNDIDSSPTRRIDVEAARHAAEAEAARHAADNDAAHQAADAEAAMRADAAWTESGARPAATTEDASGTPPVDAGRVPSETTPAGATPTRTTPAEGTPPGSMPAQTADGTVPAGAAPTEETGAAPGGTPESAAGPAHAAADDEPDGPAFDPANETEQDLFDAAGDGRTEQFLSTLLLSRVLIPLPDGASPDARLDDEDFPWRRDEIEGQPYLVAFTSPARMAEFLGDDVTAVNAKFIQLIHVWPDVKWAFAVNPGSPVGAMLPGIQIKALAAWADDAGLTDDEGFAVYDESEGEAPAPNAPLIMQKPIASTQVDYYLERGYDRASGFVHRAAEVMHLHTPEQMISTLGLTYSGSPFRRDATEIYVLRWAALRPDLYRIPYGGQHEAAMRAMQGWMIERAPFRGNGFAPAENGEVIAEFKVDSIRLPHGAQMWRLTREGRKTLIAMLDADECLWRPVRGVDSEAVWDPSVPVVPPTPSVEGRKRAAVPRGRKADPIDDPLDPRWRGTGRRGSRSSDGTGGSVRGRAGER
jgi:hypothetical protein